MNFAICNEIFRDWEFDRVCEYVGGLGYSALEIAPFTLGDSVRQVSQAERQRVRAAATRNGLEIAGIHWVLVKPEGLYINHPERAVRERTAEYFCDLVDFCADLGGKCMVVGSPKQRNIMTGVSRQQAEDWALGTFEPAVKRAEKCGVTICVEPLGPAETNFINTAAAGLQFTARLPSPSFKLILDVKAMSTEGRPIPEIIRGSTPHFAHFHANDPNLKGPGFGAVDFGPIAAALKAAGYSGFVSVEVFNFDDGAEAIASKSLEYLRHCFGSQPLTA